MILYIIITIITTATAKNSGSTLTAPDVYFLTVYYRYYSLQSPLPGTSAGGMIAWVDLHCSDLGGRPRLELKLLREFNGSLKQGWTYVGAIWDAI